MNKEINKNLPIGFFDSGVGGLSVYSKFVKLLPNENTIYFGDLKNIPYGNKSKNDLLMFARKILDFFKTQNVKAVVIACNTSSAIVYETVKNEYDFEIYPIIQSCTKVISSYNYEIIGVFATSATIKSDIYEKEIQKYSPKTKVIQLACPNWVNFVENKTIESKECLLDTKFQIETMLKHNPQKIILGCTHFPYLTKILSNFVSKDIFIDPADIFVEYIKNSLCEKSILNDNKTNGRKEFYVSASPQNFVESAKVFYELQTLPKLIEL
ncbi:MAG: glutamate racemase [bacterium]|nr:glutamate racemase [bacterium]